MDAFHERLAQVALRAGSDRGFALAGGYAVQAHGFLIRPSEDVDLFTSAERTDFRDGVAAIKSAYEKDGIAVRVDICSGHFARLWVTDTESGQSSKVELAADIRSKAPVAMRIGPVVHVDDVAGGKMEALFTRAEARDFIDIDAMVTSGRFTRRRLQELAAARDAGFELLVLADMLAVLDIYPDAEFSAYGLRAEQIQQLRERFAKWRTELLCKPGPTGT
ncbi:MAG TPA: nucleotidyl transferase AbiEii/AbiGii toxin family protein [Streptosporangiaceae bacterium]